MYGSQPSPFISVQAVCDVPASSELSTMAGYVRCMLSNAGPKTLCNACGLTFQRGKGGSEKACAGKSSHKAHSTKPQPKNLKKTSKVWHEEEREVMDAAVTLIDT